MERPDHEAPPGSCGSAMAFGPAATSNASHAVEVRAVRSTIVHREPGVPPRSPIGRGLHLGAISNWGIGEPFPQTAEWFRVTVAGRAAARPAIPATELIG